MSSVEQIMPFGTKSPDEVEKVDIRNPYSTEVVGSAASFSATDVAHAVAVAGRYDFSLSGYERYDILARTSHAVRERKREFAELITSEIGISLKDAGHEVDRTVNVILLAAEEAKRVAGEAPPAEVSPEFRGRTVLVLREPVGIVGCITPFNHPLNQVAHKVCPALAAGNAVVLKPSVKAPLTALLFAELLKENGLPFAMMQIVTGIDRLVGPALTQNPKIDMISFTGSTHVGEHIARTCGVKKLSLELGGNDAFIVAPDADVERAAAIAAPGAFANSGQRCSSIKRIITFPENGATFAEALASEAKRLVVGDPKDSATDIGTVVNEESAIEIERRIIAAISAGATLLAGGEREGAQVWPTVLDHVNVESDVVREETFGPVAPIIRAGDMNEAVEIANGTPYGLNAGIMTSDIDVALDVAKRLKVGGVRINNAPSYRNEYVPFGGNKMSGYGRTGVKYAVLETTTLKTIII